jgi:N-acyl homoserine lactone hydrolase
MITPLQLSEVVQPPNHPRAGEACLVFGFVIHHDDGPVLVDTGVGVGHPDIDLAFSPVHHPISNLLAEVGVGIGDVRMVINSHLHFDHCGNNRLFPDVPLVAQLTEYENAREPGYTIPDWVDFPGATWQPIDGESEVLRGVRAFPTPGHTPGHQSVAVSTGDVVEVIAGQAVYDQDEFDAEASVEPLAESEATQTAVSARRIKAMSPARVYFSHDSRVWRESLSEQGSG